MTDLRNDIELREALTELRNTMVPVLYRKYIECEIARLENKLATEGDWLIGTTTTMRHDHFRKVLEVHRKFLDSAEKV